MTIFFRQQEGIPKLGRNTYTHHLLGEGYTIPPPGLTLVSVLFFQKPIPLFLETTSKRKLQPILLTEQVGTHVTLNCPVSPLIVRIYRNLRRTKSGKELDQATRQIGQLLGIKYKWSKDKKPIQHHRSAWFMKLQAVQVEDEGLYKCKVTMLAKPDKTQTFILKVFSK